MNKNDFHFEKEINDEYGIYTACINDIEVSIPENMFNDEKIVEIYPSKLYDIASYCKESACFKMCYPKVSIEEIIHKLHLPVLRVGPNDGILTYCNHELDDEHLLDLEFGGILETFFSVSVDG